MWLGSEAWNPQATLACVTYGMMPSSLPIRYKPKLSPMSQLISARMGCPPLNYETLQDPRPKGRGSCRTGQRHGALFRLHRFSLRDSATDTSAYCLNITNI